MTSDKSTSGNMDRSASRPKTNPGDQAAPGTPGAGENVCPDCRGGGRVNNAPCKTCGGTGKVIEGIAGG